MHVVFQSVKFWLNIPLRGSSCYSYTMGCPPVRGNISRALEGGLSYEQVDKHDITILYHTLQITTYFVLKLLRVVYFYLLHMVRRQQE